MKIRLDLDGVVCDFVKSLSLLSNKVKRINDYQLGLEKDEFMQLWNKFSDLQGFVGIKWIKDAEKSINYLLSQNHEISFVTDRREEDQIQTYYWRELNGWGKKIPIHFTDNKKVDFLKNRFSDIIIEDKKEIIKEGRDLGLNIWCFRHPWNEEIKEKVFNSWKEILEEIAKIGRY